jgi:serine protease AprX
MKKVCCLVLYVILSLPVAYSQNRYIFFFKDKNNSPYSLSNPQQYLSAKAIARRAAFNIAIDSSDLPVNPTYIQGVSATGATILNTTKWFNGVIIETSSPSVLTAISTLPFVKNFNAVGRQAINPSSPSKFSKEEFLPLSNSINSGLRTVAYNYGQAANQTNMIGLAGLHNAGFSGENMLIAVLDAGFLNANTLTCFDSLFQQNRIVATWDFVDHEADVYNDHNHGTSVLSCMAANVPGDMVGTAPHAKYILLRSEDANSEYIIEEYNYAVAAEYADSSGADIMHASLGYYQFDDASQNHVYSDMDGNTCPAAIAADMAASKGILVTSSAGNEGNSAWQYLITPSDGDSVLSVGAVDPSGIYASFSSLGPASDGQIKPDVAAQGKQTVLYSPWSGSSPGTGNGTSFSGPIIAGAAACLWQSSPQHTNMEIIQAIKRSASQYTNPDAYLGYGIPDFSFANNLLGLGNVSIPDKSPLHIYPNPAIAGSDLNVLYFNTKSDQIKVRIFDTTGRKLWENTANSFGSGYSRIVLQPALSPGVYILEADGSNGRHATRFVLR